MCLFCKFATLEILKNNGFSYIACDRRMHATMIFFNVQNTCTKMPKLLAAKNEGFISSICFLFQFCFTHTCLCAEFMTFAEVCWNSFRYDTVWHIIPDQHQLICNAVTARQQKQQNIKNTIKMLDNRISRCHQLAPRTCDRQSWNHSNVQHNKCMHVCVRACVLIGSTIVSVKRTSFLSCCCCSMHFYSALQPFLSTSSILCGSKTA